jgi:hypothetical protein
MNMKSLLLGSAAALVAVTGARAADAVVIAEPEPMDYVRVCDTYGTGFYYIPGTETCLRIGGYMQYDIGVGFLGFEDVVDKKDDLDGEFNTNDTYFKRARASVQIDARSETELGTLRSYMEFRFNDDQTTVEEDGFTNTTQSWEINHGYIELGGFRVGKTDSLFSTFTGYAGGVINDSFDGLSYGPFDTNQIAYTFTGGNGFAAAVALEEGNGHDFTIDSYMPHVVGGASFTQGWGGISAVAGYDSVNEEWAAKARVDFNATEALSLFVMAGWKSGANEDGDFDDLNYYGDWSGDWIIFGGATFEATEKAAINVQLSVNEAEDFAAVANVAYKLVPGLTITPEIVYVNYGDEADDIEDDHWGGWLRFRRSF